MKRCSSPESLGAGRVCALVCAAALAVMLNLGCGVKKTVRVSVPPQILSAKTASFQQLLALLETYTEKITALSSNDMKVSFTSGKPESGQLQAYRSAPGYILLKRPDQIRMVIQNPLTKTAILDLASIGDDFSVWLPRDNRFYAGKNSARELAAEGGASIPSFSARPIHIFQALLPQQIGFLSPGVFVAMEEDQDSSAKYYVLSVYRDEGAARLVPVRKLWVERSRLTIAKQQVYEGDGSIVSIIQYSDLREINGLLMPFAIRIDRPVDGYALALEFKSWRINPDLPDNAFVLKPPAGAERVQLREKGKQ